MHQFLGCALAMQPMFFCRCRCCCFVASLSCCLVVLLSCLGFIAKEAIEAIKTIEDIVIYCAAYGAERLFSLVYCILSNLLKCHKKSIKVAINASFCISVAIKQFSLELKRFLSQEVNVKGLVVKRGMYAIQKVSIP